MIGIVYYIKTGIWLDAGYFCFGCCDWELSEVPCLSGFHDFYGYCGGFEFGGVLFDHGNGVVVHWDDEVGSDEFGCFGCELGSHGEAVADGEHCDVGFIDFADEFHVGEEVGIACVVDGVSCDIENDSARHSHVLTVVG